MRLGTHEELVNEVIFLFRGIAESSVFPSAENPDHTELDEATRAAWEETHGDDELTWSDIRSFEMRAVWETAYASEEFKSIESSLRAAIEGLSNALAKHFRGSKFERIGEDVISDMQNSVYSRAVVGASNSFFENLIKAYRRGAWPCGWYGNYPSGRLKTFAQK